MLCRNTRWLAPVVPSWSSPHPPLCRPGQNSGQARWHADGTTGLRHRLSRWTPFGPGLVAFRASSEEVVACWRGTSNFCTVARDSPSFAAQPGCRRPQRVQHLFLGRRGHLLLGQRVSILAIHRLQSQHVFAAQTANRSGDVSLAAGPLAKLAGHLGREFRAGRTGHLLQGLRNFAVGEHIQERRLPQGNVERRLQRVVEDRIARAVGEVGENDGVFLGQWVAPMRTVVEPGGRGGRTRIAASKYRRTLPAWTGEGACPHRVGGDG